jgi:hypothetical protein
MDELNRSHREASAESRTGPDRSGAQPRLPLELPLDAPLPFDDEADEPVGMSLTARARRVIAPDELPSLRVVADPADVPGPVRDSAPPPTASPASSGSGAPTRVDDDPSDTRPSRARALRRAGRTPARIAEHLGVDELLVRAWVADVAPRHSRRRSSGTRDQEVGAAPNRDSCAPGGRVRSAHPSLGAYRDDARDEARADAHPAGSDGVDHHRTAFELARAAARDEARRERLADPAFAGGIGLLAGVAELDAHAVTITTQDSEVAAAALRWLRQQLTVTANRERVVLRIGPRVAGDLAAHRWAKRLEVPREGIAVATWRQAPSDDAEQVLLRIADPTVAATVAGWRDALLTPPGDDPADVAF